MSRLPAVALAVLLGISLWAGIRGLDFGRHWDERHLVKQAHDALRKELLLPRSYHYPSVSFWLTTAGLAMGEVPEKLVSPSLRPDGQRTAVPPPPPMEGDPVLRIRAVFLFFSVPILLWTFLAGRAAGLRSWAAVFAAGLVGLSFELGYHQRWIAPDAVMAQLAALALFCLIKARENERWFIPAAIAAGLCCGTKYTGGILLLGVLWIALQVPEKKAKIRFALTGVGVFAATFLITTPGAALDFGLFFRHLDYEITHYAKGHGSYTVDGFFQHLGLAFRWMGDTAFSPWPPAAIALALLALAGFVFVPKRHRLLLIALPTLYLLFMARQKVFITRNLLILLPFLAVAAGFAVQSIYDRLRPRWVKLALGGLFTAPILAQAGSQIHAAETITDRRTSRFVEDFKAWCADHPAAALQPSSKVLKKVGAQPCFGGGPNRAVFLSEGHADSRKYPTLGERWFDEVFGPRDVNLRWYGSWLGDDRIVVIDSPVLNLAPKQSTLAP